MTLALSRFELELLQRIVRQYYMNLRAEIYHTDSSDFKKGLKHEEFLLLRLLEKLEKPPGPPVECGMWERA